MSFFNQIVSTFSWLIPFILAFFCCFFAALASVNGSHMWVMVLQGIATVASAFGGAKRALWVLGDWHSRAGFLQEEIVYLLNWTLCAAIAATVLAIFFRCCLALVAAGKTSDEDDFRSMDDFSSMNDFRRMDGGVCRTDGGSRRIK